jgi:HrpA-like RNA helicase
MGLPTLGRLGSLTDPNGDPARQAEFDKIIPIDYIINWFQDRMTKTGIENRVLILKAETASGKSTYFLQELYKRLIRGSKSPGLICTQPRILTAVRNIFEIIKYNRDTLILGDTIGFSAGGNKVLPKAPQSIKNVTVETLTMELKLNTDEEIMNKYKYILIDETHERSLSIDMTLYMLKNFLIRNQGNPKCPFVVCMSATFDPDIYVKYFNGSIESNYIWVRGAAYPREYMWEWNQGRIVNNYAQAAAECVRRIVMNAPNENPLTADVLIFMPGAEEFKMTAKWLHELNIELIKKNISPFALLQIDSEAMKTKNRDYVALDIPVAMQKYVYNEKIYKPSRRVIICTNVAETGLTLENLKYVIDAGFNKETEFNPNYNIHSLLVKPAPVSRIIQRIGRVGRNFPGVFYPLYPKYIYDEFLPRQQFPQILLDDSSIITIDIINEQIKSGKEYFSVTDIDMLDPPSVDTMIYSLNKLYRLGFIRICDNECNTRYQLTDLGAISSVFTMIPPESIRMILSTFAWGCSTLDVITIAAYLATTRGITKTDKKSGQKLPLGWNKIYEDGLSIKFDYEKWRHLVCDDFIDGIVLLNAIKKVIKTSIENLPEWCEKNNINYKELLVFLRTRDDIIEQSLRAQLDIFRNEKYSLGNCSGENIMSVLTAIKYCIYDGYRCNMLIHDGSGYVSMYGNVNVLEPGIIRDKTLGAPFKALPKVLLYRSLGVKLNRKDPLKTYNIVPDKVSSMSGFVHTDYNFI